MTLKPEPAFDNFSLFSKISHELKNPIHGISGLSNYLHDNWETLDEATKKSCVTDIYKAGTLLQNVVDKLFHLSSLNDENIIFNFEKANIVKIAKKAIDDNKLFIIDKNSMDIFLEVEEKEIYMSIDKFWINQLLYNLINNATKHSGAKNIKVKINSQTEDFVISVIDDGVGIPQSELVSIFAPFTQSSAIKNSAKGSGLGLAICQEVVAAHGGKIWASNNKEGGASISFTIPKEK